MNSKALSEKLIIYNKNNKVDFFIKSIIKDYKLMSERRLFYDGETLTPNNHYIHDARNKLLS